MSSTTSSMNNTHNNNNNRSNNIFSNSNKNSSNTNGKGARSHKKVDEVKEVIQNKPDAEIQKVLEYFDFDVGNTIDAFVKDGGKEALAKWHETKANSKQQHTNHKSQQSNSTTDGADSNLLQLKNNNINKNSTNPKRLDLKASLNLGNDHQNNTHTNNNKQQKFFSSSLSAKKTSNINDLVASVINQYTNSTPSTPLSGSISANMQLLANDDTPQQQQQQEQQNQSLLDNLNRLVISSQTSNASTATIGGFKVTVLGVQTSKNDSPAISSIASSPSSMSVTSNLSISSSSMNGHSLNKQPMITTNGRSSLLDMPAQINASSSSSVKRVFNTAYVNPNARQLLEKHQKDLQRQTTVLNRVANVFQDDLNRSQQTLNQTFAQLRQLLNDRQAQLETQLIVAAQTGSNLLQQRQSKAAELKIMADNAQHLSDVEAQELKADIKHFVSERQLDEEFGKLNFLNLDNLMQLNQTIASLGSITTLTNKYAKQRPPINELNDTPPKQQPQTQANSKMNGNHSNSNNKPNKVNGVTDKNNNKQQQQQQNLTNGANGNGVTSNNNAAKLNGNANNIINEISSNGFIKENDDEGEFIEVKKPQRNKNKQQPQIQPQVQQQQQQPINSHKNQNANSKKFPKQNGFNNTNTSNQYTTVAIK